MKVACPKCHKSLNCPDQLAGKSGQCPKCKAKFRIPSVPPSFANQQLIVPSPPIELSPPPPPPPPPPPEPEPEPEPEPTKNRAEPEREFLYRDDFVTVWADESADFHFNSVAEGKLAIKGLRLFKKQIRVLLKEVNAGLREVRHQYTDYTRRRGSMIRGGGSIGKLIRFVQVLSRDSMRHQLAQNVHPLHVQKEQLERLVNTVEKHIVRIEAILLQY